jgi:hypothetical protein
MIGSDTQPLSSRSYVVCIGAQKAGTSWLFRYLQQRPEVLLSPLKEIHYFDARYRPDLCAHWDREYSNRFKQLVKKSSIAQLRDDPGLQDFIDAHLDRLRMIDDGTYYRKHFEKRVQSQHRLFGEITPAYSMLPAAGLEAIRDSFGSARVIFVMRDPVDRYWSSLKMKERNRKRLGDDSFSAIERYYPELDNPQHSERTAYHHTLDNLSRVFERRDYLVLFYEELFTDASIDRLCRFLGLDFASGNYQTIINESGSDAIPDEDMQRAAAAKFAAVYRGVAQHCAGELPARWQASLALATAGGS